MTLESSSYAPPSRRADVIGAGPVGLATAIALAERGWRVDVYEQKSSAPIDKPCGEGLMPAALAALSRLGVEVEGEDLVGIAYASEDDRILGSFPAGTVGRGVRRLELSTALVRRAMSLGVSIRWGRRVTVTATSLGYRVLDDRDPESQPAPGETSAQSWIIGAGGLRSPARRLVLEQDAAQGSVPSPRVGRRRFGARLHFARPAEFELGQRVWVYWMDGWEAYLTPVGPEQIGLAMLWTDRPGDDPRRLGIEERLELLTDWYPELRSLVEAPRRSSVRGIGPLLRRSPAVVDRNLALVGDASGYLDAITGEGLALGLWDAIDLAEALDEGDPRRYTRRHRLRRRSPYRLIRTALFLSRHSRLRRHALGLLARTGNGFDGLLAAHVGQRSHAAAFLSLATALAGSVLVRRRSRRVADGADAGG